MSDVKTHPFLFLLFALCAAAMVIASPRGFDSQAKPPTPRAFIDGTGPGWQTLTETDFAGVNGNADTWMWKDNMLVSRAAQPIGVLRTRQKVTNFELVIEWRHLKPAGNSGVFVWVPDQALAQLKPGVLPDYGIEVQMLDHGVSGSVREVGTEGRLVHHPRRHLRRRQVEADALRSGLAERLAQLSAQGVEPRCRRVESLLRARDQRRAAAVGQRRRSLGRQRRRPTHRLSVSRSGRLADRVQEHSSARAVLDNDTESRGRTSY